MQIDIFCCLPEIKPNCCACGDSDTLILVCVRTAKLW